MSISRQGLAGDRRRITATASRRSRPRSTPRSPPRPRPRATARETELKAAGVPEELARRIAEPAALAAAPDIVLVADRTGQNDRRGRRHLFRGREPSSASTASRARRAPSRSSDYFDRLALDRALDSIGDAERRLAAAMAGNGASGAAAVEAWVAARKHEVERIRTSVHEIAGSGPHAVEAVGGGEPAGRSGGTVARGRCPRLTIRTH